MALTDSGVPARDDGAVAPEHLGSPGLALARRIAADGLRPGSAPLLDEPLAPAGWQALLRLVEHERLAGLLAAVIDEGRLPVTPAQRRAADELRARALCHVLALEALLLRVTATFDAHGIEHRVLKGAAVAHWAYPDPAVRPFVDVDVLVAAAAFDRAVAVVEGLGAVRSYAEPRPGFDRRFGKGANLDVGGLGVDLHRTLALGPYGLTIELDELFACSTTVEVAGRPLPCLDPEAALLHSTVHAVLGDWPPRLLVLRDVVQLAFGPVDLERTLRLARSWQVEAPLARAVGAAWGTLAAPTHPLERWARAFRPSPRDERWLGLYTGPDRRYRRLALGALEAVPTLAGKLTYLRALAVPDRRFLDGREGTYTARLRAGLAEAAHHRVRSMDPGPARDGALRPGPAPAAPARTTEVVR